MEEFYRLADQLTSKFQQNLCFYVNDFLFSVEINEERVSDKINKKPSDTSFVSHEWAAAKFPSGFTCDFVDFI